MYNRNIILTEYLTRTATVTLDIKSIEVHHAEPSQSSCEHVTDMSRPNGGEGEASNNFIPILTREDF